MKKSSSPNIADCLLPDFNRTLAAVEEQIFQIILRKTQSRFTLDMELVEGTTTVVSAVGHPFHLHS